MLNSFSISGPYRGKCVDANKCVHVNLLDLRVVGKGREGRGGEGV